LGIEDAPPAIAPIYSTAEPNQPVLLYEGPMVLLVDAYSQKGTGVFLYEWLPVPHLSFRMETGTLVPVDLMFKTWMLQLDKIGVSLRCRIAQVRENRLKVAPNVMIEGNGFGRVFYGDDPKVRELRFHVTNFAHLEGDLVKHQRPDGLTIVLDGVWNTKELCRALEINQGHAITHVGSLTRTDGALFAPNSADDLLDNFALYLAFAKGSSCSTILRVGFNAVNDVVWREWTGTQHTGWRFARTWMNSMKPRQFVDMFPSFIGRMADDTWKGTVRHGIYWYIQGQVGQNSDRAANRAGNDRRNLSPR
jgi:hypothetical protein